jgi:hypothetical protein
MADQTNPMANAKAVELAGISFVVEPEISEQVLLDRSPLVARANAMGVL